MMHEFKKKNNKKTCQVFLYVAKDSILVHIDSCRVLVADMVPSPILPKEAMTSSYPELIYI